MNTKKTPERRKPEKKKTTHAKEPEKAPEKRPIIRSLFMFVIASSVFLILLLAITGIFLVHKYSGNLPDVSAMRNYKPSLVTTLYDQYDNLVAEYYIEKRMLKNLDSMPDIMKQATLAIEDNSFYKHKGIDFKGIARAAMVNIRAGRVVQGGSTITQQVAKLLFFTRERTFERKIKEALLSLQIEQNFSKSEILEIYLNHIYYGHGSYGVEAASQLYFNRSVEDLNVSEVAMIAGIPKAPRNFSPHFNPVAAKKRRDVVLKRMFEERYIIQPEYQEAVSEPIRVVPLKKAENFAPFFAEHVRRYLNEKYGTTSLYREGLKVYTTLNLEWQRHAQKAVREGLETTSRRLGYNGPTGWIDPETQIPEWEKLNPPQKKLPDEQYFAKGKRLKAVVRELEPEAIRFEVNGREGVIEKKGYKWAHPPDPKEDGRFFKEISNPEDILKKGDVIYVTILDYKPGAPIYAELDQIPEVQGALLSIDYRTGAIRSMVGGYDFEESSFNRTVQAYRQPGSSFKPIIYSAAFNKNLTPASVIIDSPIIFEEDIDDFKHWKPVNFRQKFYGPTTLRSAVTHSRNVVTIKLLQKIGLPYVVNWAHQLGINSTLDPNLSLALGTSGISLQELTSVYGVFANGGVRNEPFFIRRVEDRNGRVIEEHEEDPQQVIPEDTAFIMGNILHGVVKEGTGRKVRSVGVPAAGKTGTTNDFIDAWFIGFTSDIVTGVWVGKDRKGVMGKNETGSRVAAPIWLSFMKEAVKDITIKPFAPPSSVVFTRIDKETGYLAAPDNPNSFFEAFREGTAPTEYESPDAG
ncbi:MAG: PBP1A family penicillin-binding protein [Nitrospinota bacterium]